MATVARLLLKGDDDRLSALAARLGTERDALVAVVLWLVALHDIGKASIAFQALAPSHWPSECLGSLPEPPPHQHHTELTAWYFRKGPKPGPLRARLLDLLPGCGDTAVGRVVGAIAGHHGRPVASLDPTAAGLAFLESDRVGSSAVEAAEAIADNLAALFDVRPVGAAPARDAPTEFAWYLATLLPLADWVGSNQEWFPVTPEPMPLAAYWERAQDRAAHAVGAAGLVPAGIAPPSPAVTLPHIARLSPAQDWAANVPLPASGPVLAIIEDATGAGKTEAGLLLAHRMMAAGLARGFHMALPTMATADAMHARLGALYRNFFLEEPSLALAHGRARRRQVEDAEGTDPDDGPVAAWCADWIAGENRKAFFAQAGAGTVDQAILAVLASKYQTLRLRGLSDKVLVIDEAHAFDAYVSEEIAGLLRFHAAQGAPAILLSATLPNAKRRALVEAYAQGAGWDASDFEPVSNAFPLASLASAEGLRETPLRARAEASRRIDVERLGSVEEGERAALEAARAGGAVALLRTTVDGAIASHERLRDLTGGETVELLLFHARFLPADRAAIERRVMALFGKDSAPEARRGRLLVATAVIEQSLDIDFDAMVSDLAPIDLMIQRAGRVWRHERDARPLDAPVLRVVSPDPPEEPDTSWLKDDLVEAVWVYRDPALLWRSARAVFGAGGAGAFEGGTLDEGAEAPRHPRRLVEAVYGELPETLPEGLQDAADHAWGDELAQRAIARRNILDPRRAYARGNGSWDDEARVMTRLGDALTVRLARADGERLVPLHGEGWQESELRLGPRLARGLEEPSDATAVRLHPRWGRADVGKLLCVMEEREEGWVDADGTRAYDRARGFRLVTGDDPYVG